MSTIYIDPSTPPTLTTDVPMCGIHVYQVLTRHQQSLHLRAALKIPPRPAAYFTDPDRIWVPQPFAHPRPFDPTLLEPPVIFSKDEQGLRVGTVRAWGPNLLKDCTFHEACRAFTRRVPKFINFILRWPGYPNFQYEAQIDTQPNNQYMTCLQLAKCVAEHVVTFTRKVEIEKCTNEDWKICNKRDEWGIKWWEIVLVSFVNIQGNLWLASLAIDDSSEEKSSEVVEKENNATKCDGVEYGFPGADYTEANDTGVNDDEGYNTEA
ncbi:hypothetical protein AX16_005921 [Volvariella volvacea WC 439]|nr:hypothetical protein AX16_005921 [Volvariella volvacea WC 439]